MVLPRNSGKCGSARSIIARTRQVRRFLICGVKASVTIERNANSAPNLEPGVEHVIITRHFKKNLWQSLESRKKEKKTRRFARGPLRLSGVRTWANRRC